MLRFFVRHLEMCSLGPRWVGPALLQYSPDRLGTEMGHNEGVYHLTFKIK